MTQESPQTFQDVTREELKAVHGAESSGDLRAMRKQVFESGTAALCLSGGGIRSASFGLGALQGFAKRSFLRKFHYLSTVSGGGYIGSFISAWAYRAAGGIAEVEEGLVNTAAPDAPIAQFRKYTNYLSPKRGLTSLDAWTLAATYLRNLLLNWMVLLPLLTLLLTVPNLMVTLLEATSEWNQDSRWAQQLIDWPMFTALALLTLGSLTLRQNSSLLSTRAVEAQTATDRWPQLFFGLSVLLMCVSLYWRSELEPDRDWLAPPTLMLYFAFNVPLAWWFVVGWLAREPSALRNLYWFSYITLVFVVSAVFGGLLIQAWSKLFPAGEEIDWLRRFVVIGPPSLLLALVAAEVLFQGLASKLSNDYDREWWSRACGRMFLLSGGWFLWMGLALYGPEILRESWVGAREWIGSVSAVTGGVLARVAFVSRVESRENEGLWQRVSGIVFRVLALAFIAVFLALIATGVDALIAITSDNTQQLGPHAKCVDVVLVAAGLSLVIGLFSSTININWFSLHAMYRERLIRAFLGTSRKPTPVRPPDPDKKYDELEQFEPRRASRFIDFDRYDNPILWWLRPGRKPAAAKAPFHVLNCALNLVGDTNLAWQERKATSFTFSPLHAGYRDAYRPSNEYCGSVGGVTLGTALTISGAAVSPNAGYHTSIISTVLLTIFNARLGWWLGNTTDAQAARKAGPTLAVVPLLRELLGKTDAKGKWIYLSDGGHFDNLGLYEMVRRACRYIVVVDGSADPDRTFDDLGNALRKIRVDFGIPIERYPNSPWRIGSPDLGARGRSCALFSIDYTPWLGKRPSGEPSHGLLLYIKPAYYRHEDSRVPIDVAQYASTSLEFPHQPTVDQFYDESQLESYRALGEHEVDLLFGPLDDSASFDDLMSAAGMYIQGT